MTTLLIPAIPAWYLIIIGIAIVGVELFFMNLFVILWFGLAAIFIGALNLFLPFSHGEYQLLLIALIGSTALFMYHKKYKPSRTKNKHLDSYTTGGTGSVITTNQGIKINYQGTLWSIAPPAPTNLKDGDNVIIKEIKSNQVVL